MEVHAHSHTARKKWTHYIWKFLMPFLAVFGGFLTLLSSIKKFYIPRKQESYSMGELLSQ